MELLDLWTGKVVIYIHIREALLPVLLPVAWSVAWPVAWPVAI
jgi:hypothetical protein